jgi:hypothetical protein
MPPAVGLNNVFSLDSLSSSDANIPSIVKEWNKFSISIKYICSQKNMIRIFVFLINKRNIIIGVFPNKDN